jgi:putative Holliday junction resolvase
MRCLGLDLGTRTCGLAMSDKTNFIASPFKTLKWDGENYDLLFVELDTIIKDYGITDLVLGLPKNMNNTLGFASERSLKFKEALESRYGIEVYLIDERLSTMEATNYLLEADVSRKKRKQVVDGVAASIILDTYLKMKGNK